jgi:hypothetical protein
MAQRTDPFQPHKHVCIFELERKGRYFTPNVVCTVCGLRLHSADQSPQIEDATPENQQHL